MVGEKSPVPDSIRKARLIVDVIRCILHGAMLMKSLLPLVLFVMAGHAAENHRPNRFMVRISENWSTLNPTAGPNNLSNCLIVFPDGRLHLELRRQEFFDGRMTMLATYESLLDSKAMEGLENILDHAEVRRLPPFVQPVVPMNVDDWQGFHAEIARGTQLQQVGFFTWHGEGPRNSDTDKTAWKLAAFTLMPLVDWSRSVKSYAIPKWRQVHTPKTVCGQ